MRPHLHFDPKLPLDVLGQNVVNLRVTRDWLLLPVRRVEIDIVAGPGAVKDAAGVRELTDELASLHTDILLVL
jgi:hypothetical protein